MIGKVRFGESRIKEMEIDEENIEVVEMVGLKINPS